MSKKRVSYFYDGAPNTLRDDNRAVMSYHVLEEIGSYYYGQGHPMKPHRIRMTHNLLLNYGAYQFMEIYRPPRASQQDMEKFHMRDYLEFLQHVTPDTLHQYADVMRKYSIGEECPLFDGVYEFSRISSGGSIGGAVKLNNHQCDIAVNWAGGLHHAKKGEASGFCYVNDIVLGILELLKRHPRVMYLDIDIHHGDGVEEAFYSTDRVLTCSFHKYGNFFPGTGHINDIGVGVGRGYSVNVPLTDGIDDESYHFIFKPVMQRIMDVYRPTAIVVQCGGDSLAGDRLGCFNLSIQGHAECVRFMKSFNVPTLVLGGGGYTVRNVSRCWAAETAVCLDMELNSDLPPNDYMDYYGPGHKLYIPVSTISNQNTRQKLERMREDIFENLRRIQPAPGVQMHDVPGDLFAMEREDDLNPDIRMPEQLRDQHVSRDPHDDGFTSTYLPGGDDNAMASGGTKKQPPTDGPANADVLEVPDIFEDSKLFPRPSVSMIQPIH